MILPTIIEITILLHHWLAPVAFTTWAHTETFM